MKKLATLLLARALMGALGFAALVPAAFADDRAPGFGPRSERGMQMHRDGEGDMRMRGPGAAFMLAGVMCDDDGAARLETMFDRLETRLKLTGEQQPLFETLKTTALTAQTGYADACATPAKADDVDFIDRLKARQTNMAAHLTAMSEVMPALEAFYDSLSDEQKNGLIPDMHDGGKRFEHFREHRGNRGPHRG